VGLPSGGPSDVAQLVLRDLIAGWLAGLLACLLCLAGCGDMDHGMCLLELGFCIVCRRRQEAHGLSRFMANTTKQRPLLLRAYLLADQVNTERAMSSVEDISLSGRSVERAWSELEIRSSCV
jgi:hypothetical protein